MILDQNGQPIRFEAHQIQQKYDAIEEELKKELGEQDIPDIENRLQQFIKKGPTGNKLEHYVFDNKLILEVELINVAGINTWVFRKPVKGDASGIVMVN